MKNLKKIFEAIALCMLIYIAYRIIKDKGFINVLTQNFSYEKILIICCIIVIFLFIHLMRAFRLYILLIEEKMKLKEFIPLYLKTTLVNNIIPFKLGEFYKMLCYGKKLKSFSAGLSLIWIDRFLDSIILVILVAIASKLNISSGIFAVLIVFIVFSVVIYLSFESSYKYFNTLVLEKGTSKRSKVYLEIIEECNKVYEKAKRMLSYRGMPLIILSVVIWGAEYLLAYFSFNLLFNMEFNLNIFVEYINNVFIVFNQKYSLIFNFSIIMMIIVFAIIYAIVKISVKKKRKEELN